MNRLIALRMPRMPKVVGPAFASEVVVDFAAFWQLYPRRVARATAERAWGRLDSSSRLRALEALPRHVAHWGDSDLRFVPHASTWLNGQRWLDELVDAEDLRARRLMEGVCW